MKFPDFKWPGWVAKIWTPSSPLTKDDGYSDRMEMLFPKSSEVKADEDVVIFLGDHSHNWDPSKSK
jgi:hypothetical protein